MSLSMLAMTILNRTVNCVTLCFLYFGRPIGSLEKRLLWLWTTLPWCWADEAVPWISHGIFFFWYFILLVRFWVLHCVDVGSAYVLHLAERPPRVVQTSEWQWTASVFTTWHCTGSCSSLFTVHKCFQRYLTACFVRWTGVTDRCVRWYSASC